MIENIDENLISTVMQASEISWHSAETEIMWAKINEIIDYLNFQEKLKKQELLRMVQPVHRGANAAEYQNSTM